jgi:hypothetical protein
MKAKRSKCFDIYGKYDVACDQKECRQWIDYEDDLNCTIVCVNRHGPMTLQEVAPRLGVSFVRVKQNQDMALQKLSRTLKRDHVELIE